MPNERELKGRRDAGEKERAILLLLLAAFLFAFVPSTPAQFLKGFSFPGFFEPQELKPGQTNRLKYLVIGNEVLGLSNSLYRVIGVRIERYGIDGQTNLVAKTSEGLLDISRRTAFSTNKLELEVNNGQMLTEGVGFFCHLTNFTLFLSNQVRTYLREDIARSARGPAPRLPGFASPAGAGTNASPTNTYIKISSDQLDFEYQANFAVYSNHVRVENPPLELRSELLTIRRSPEGAVESIVADKDVVITNTVEHSSATGDQALYLVDQETETLVLIGKPARWRDAQRSGQAREFTYDLKAQLLRAEGEAEMTLPRSAMNQGDWLLARPAAPAPGATNAFVKVAAELMIVQFPTTNHPAHHVTAETNVVILSPADKTRATSDRAIYSEASGTGELIGHATWERDQRVAKGDRLFFDRTNRIFRAQGDAYLKLPLAEFNRQSIFPAPGSAIAKTTNAAPQFMELWSDQYEYRNEFLTFRDGVRGQLLEGETVRATLAAAESLRVKFTSNQVERVVARNKVALEELPIPSPDGKVSGKKLNCEVLWLFLGTNGQLQRLVAETNVFIQQSNMVIQPTNKSPRPSRPIYSSLKAEAVMMEFYAHTNDVREMVAERGVEIRHDLRWASGAKAVYNGTNHLFELTGNPKAEAPEGQITEAEAIIWNRENNTFGSLKPKATGNPPPNIQRSRLPWKK